MKKLPRFPGPLFLEGKEVLWSSTQFLDSIFCCRLLFGKNEDGFKSAEQPEKNSESISQEEEMKDRLGDVCLDVETLDTKMTKTEMEFEFAGHSSEDDFEFEGNSSDEDTTVEHNFFEGASDDDSIDSIDLFEPSSEKNVDQFTFTSVENVILEQYKSVNRGGMNNKHDDLVDYSDPIKGEETENMSCSRFCQNKCGKLMKSLSFMCEMREIKNKLSSLDRFGKRNHLLSQLAYQDQFDLPIDVFMVKSEPICLHFFSRVSGVSVRVLSSVMVDHRNGVNQYTNPHSRQQMSAKMMRFISWAVSFVKLHGEHSPEDKGVVTLPSWLTKAKLYERYTDSVGTERLAPSTFYQALGSKFGRERDDVSLPCICIPKDSDHCKCNDCLSYKKFRRTAKTELQISVADKLLQSHLDICARERIRVWGLFQRCVDFKDEHLGLQFDDMDQSKTSLPKFAERCKSLQNFNQLKNHCTGVIVHSGLYPDNRSVHFYLNQDQFQQVLGCNNHLFNLEILTSTY